MRDDAEPTAIRRDARPQVLAWVRAFRPPAQINLALPMIVGLARGTAHGAPLGALPWARGLTVSLLLQAMILFSNEASDAATDRLDARTIISGGAGVGASGDLSPRALRTAAVAAGMSGFGVCVAFGAAPLAGLWLVAASLVWAYDGRTLRLSRHPLGCLCQAIGVGVVTPLMGGWLAARPALPSARDVLIGLSLGLSGHILSALPDARADRAVGKITIVVHLGAPRAFVWMLAGFAGAAFALFAVDRWEPLPLAASLAMLAVAWGLRGGATFWPEPPADARPQPRRAQLATVRPGGLGGESWLSGLVAVALWTSWIARSLAS